MYTQNSQNQQSSQREEIEKAWKEISELIRSKDAKGLALKLFNVNLTPMQEEIVRIVAFDEHKRVVITCMTRYGKSYSVAIGACIWILTHPNKRIGIIAPTNEKTTIIRNYIASMVVKSYFMINLLDLEKTGISKIQKEVSKKRMTWKNGVEMRTLSAEGKGEQLMGFGFHKTIVDEECDIDFEVYRSKITRMIGESADATYVGIGNPWHRDNQMWLHWTDPNWYQIHIGYEVAIKENRITKEFIEEQRNQLTDREFKILYEAEFPEESEDQLIKWSWIQNALRLPKVTYINQPKRIGVDVARSGNDSTVLTYGFKDGENYIVIGIKDYNQEDTMQTTSRVLSLSEIETPEEVVIDTSGLGAGVTDRLNELKKENKFKPRVISYMGGMQPTTDKAKERFLNQKAEAYFFLRELFEQGKIFIIKNPKLIDQLTKMKWEITTSRKIRIRDPGEKEGDTAEQKSPDFADSLCYFVWWGGKQPFVMGMVNLKK